MGPIILLTGANGFVGFKVLLNALEQGYTVRAAVRSMSKSDVLTKNPKIRALQASDRPSFVEVPDIPGPFDSMVPAYSAGKIAALNATERFVKENSPSFDVVNIFPGFVFGTDDRALQVEDIMASTNRILLGVITGQVAPGPMPAGACHVYDVSKLFLQALDAAAPKNIGATVPHEFNEAWDIVKERFPEAVKNGTFTQGKQETIPIDWNAHQTELDFGFQFRTWSDMVIDVAGQYLELSGKAKE